MRVFKCVAFASVLFAGSIDVQATSLRPSASANLAGSGIQQPLNWGDFDGDGLADIYLCAIDAPDRLLRNEGNGKFEDVSATALPIERGKSKISLWRDIDGDSRPDLILVCLTGEINVLHNHGGFFLDATEVSGIVHGSPVLGIRTFDFDADGRLDLELESESGPSLWHNIGSVAFERVSLVNFDPTNRGSSVSVIGETDSGTAEVPFGNSASSTTSAGNTNAAINIVPPSDRVRLAPPVGNDQRSAAAPGVTKGTSTTPVSAASVLTTIAGIRPFKLAFGCAESIHDQVTGKCTLVSTTPKMGRIYPLGFEFNIDVAGNVGIGTFTPAAKLDVAGTARMNDTLTLEPSGDEALDISTGSIYKGGALFIHTKGGAGNTSVGSDALINISSGFLDTACGYRALLSNTTGTQNTASGSQALYSNTTANRNTAVGTSALRSNTTGDDNTASGVSALRSNSTGSANTAFGSFSLYANTTGIRNSAIGYRALNFNTTGYRNTAMGVRALHSNTTGFANTATGGLALFSNISGKRNTANGYRALHANTTGNRNTASGVMALHLNTIGSHNTATGFQALYSNTTGTRNTANGYDALRSNSTGNDNSATGFKALFANTTGFKNTALGNRTLAFNTTGFGNHAAGYRALYSNTSGSNNAANGYQSLITNTTGSYNTATGPRALLANTVGYKNTANGSRALTFNTTGSRNTASGTRALQSNTTGEDNIGLGYKAGVYLTTGSNNIAIGNRGVTAESATIRVGTASTHTRSFVAGIRGVTTDLANAVAVMIDSAGQLGTVSSSRRYKEDIHDMGMATERLLDLRPVVFRYKPEVQAGERPLEYGLIAEEVAEVFPELVVYDEDGQPLTVKYHLLSSMLLNELHGIVDQLGKNTAELHAHKRELQELRAMLAGFNLGDVPYATPTDGAGKWK